MSARFDIGGIEIGYWQGMRRVQLCSIAAPLYESWRASDIVFNAPQFEDEVSSAMQLYDAWHE